MSEQGDAYLVWEHGEEGERDGVRIAALDPEQAAERWAERCDYRSAEYDIVSQRHTPTVVVRAPDGTETRWRVTGESVPCYTATEVDREW